MGMANCVGRERAELELFDQDLLLPSLLLVEVIVMVRVDKSFGVCCFTRYNTLGVVCEWMLSCQ